MNKLNLLKSNNNVFLVSLIVLLLLLLISSYSKTSFSQMVSPPTYKHVQNISVIILPNKDGYFKNKYTSNQENHLISPTEYKIKPINNTISFTIVNSTITLEENSINGTTKNFNDISNHYIIKPIKKMVKGKI